MMQSEWRVKYAGSEIKVVNTWFSGEYLYVNNELQDKTGSLDGLSATLTGHVYDENGIKKSIKVHLGGTLQVRCIVIIDGKEFEPTKVK